MKLIPIYSNQPLNSDWQGFFENSREELRKQEAKEKENNKEPKEKEIDEKSVLDLIREIVEILNSHTEAIEALADKIDEIAETQAERPTGRAPVEPTKKDLEVIEKQIEQLGLCGEIRKILPFQVIGGKIEKP